MKSNYLSKRPRPRIKAPLHWWRGVGGEVSKIDRYPAGAFAGVKSACVMYSVPAVVVPVLKLPTQIS